MFDFNKRRPTHRMFFKLTLLPYQEHIKFINEALHIFKKDDLKYNNTIKNSINRAIHGLLDGKNNIKLYTNKNILFFKITIDNLISEVKQLDLYIGINHMLKGSDMDVINITYDYTENINSKCCPLSISNIPGEYDKITIIAEIAQDCLYNQQYKNILISSIHHELIHVLHDIKQTNLSYKAGEAFYYNNSITNLLGYNFDFTDLDILVKMYKTPDYADTILIFAAAIYYCDKSEMCAYHETIYNEFKEIIRCANNPAIYRENKEYYKNIKCLYKSNTYKIYSILLYLIHKYKADIINLKNSGYYNDNYELQQIINQYLGNNTIIQKVKGWEKDCIKFLKISHTLYYDIYNSTFNQ